MTTITDYLQQAGIRLGSPIAVIEKNDNDTEVAYMGHVLTKPPVRTGASAPDDSFDPEYDLYMLIDGGTPDSHRFHTFRIDDGARVLAHIDLMIVENTDSTIIFGQSTEFMTRAEMITAGQSGVRLS